MAKVYQLKVIEINGKTCRIDIGHSEEQMKSITVLELKQKIWEKWPALKGRTTDKEY